MLTLNTILKEIKDVPVDRLEELYQFVHSISVPTNSSEALRKKNLSFAGAFADMSNEDYKDFIEQTKKSRTNLFDRNIKI